MERNRAPHATACSVGREIARESSLGRRRNRCEGNEKSGGERRKQFPHVFPPGCRNSPLSKRADPYRQYAIRRMPPARGGPLGTAGTVRLRGGAGVPEPVGPGLTCGVWPGL